MPNSLLPALEAHRALYGQTMTPAECVAMLNAVAFSAPGWGLLDKPGGFNGARYDGHLCSVDHLVYQPTMRGIDVISDAGGFSHVGWGDIDNGEVFPAERFVSPIVPQGQPVPVPVPPTPTPNPPTDLQPILDELKSLTQQLARIERRLDAIDASTAGTLNASVTISNQLSKVSEQVRAERRVELRNSILGSVAGAIKAS